QAPVAVCVLTSERLMAPSRAFLEWPSPVRSVLYRQPRHRAARGQYHRESSNPLHAESEFWTLVTPGIRREPPAGESSRARSASRWFGPSAHHPSLGDQGLGVGWTPGLTTWQETVGGNPGGVTASARLPCLPSVSQRSLAEHRRPGSAFARAQRAPMAQGTAS